MQEPILEGNLLFYEMFDKPVLLVTDTKQLSILGQTFRPIFTGKVVAVNNGFITLDPAIIKCKMHRSLSFQHH